MLLVSLLLLLLLLLLLSLLLMWWLWLCFFGFNVCVSCLCVVVRLLVFDVYLWLVSVCLAESPRRIAQVEVSNSLRCLKSAPGVTSRNLSRSWYVDVGGVMKTNLYRRFQLGQIGFNLDHLGSSFQLGVNVSQNLWNNAPVVGRLSFPQRKKLMFFVARTAGVNLRLPLSGWKPWGQWANFSRVLTLQGGNQGP